MLIRALSALLGLGLLIAVAYFFSITGLLVVCSVVTFIGCVEFSKMIEPQSKIIQSLFVSISFAFYLSFSFYSQSFLVFISYFVFLTTYFILGSKEKLSDRMNHLSLWTVGILYCGIFAGIVSLGLERGGYLFFVTLLLVSFMTDTFAYLGGRLFGQRPLAPMISPKKTMEGAFLGLIGGSVSATYFIFTQRPDVSIIIVFLVCLMASLFSQVGDLFESMLKRHCGVKDSGQIMPGHGGVLDRIDGLLFAAPVIFMLVLNFMGEASKAF